MLRINRIDLVIFLADEACDVLREAVTVVALGERELEMG